MKRAFLFPLQTLGFLVAIGAGSFGRPFHLQSVVAQDASSSRIFVWDGLILMLVLAAIVLLTELVSRRLRSQGPWTAAAMALAVVLGLAMKLGFITKDLH